MSAVITIGGVETCADQVTVSNSITQPGMLAELEVPELPAGFDLSAGTVEVTIDLGYGATVERVFTGWTNGKQLTANQSTPGTWRLSCLGNLAFVNIASYLGKVYRKGNGESWTDGEAVMDMIAQAQVPMGTIHDVGIDMFTQAPLIVPQGQAWLPSIRRIDEVTNCITCDQPDGNITRSLWPMNDGTAPGFDWVYVEACTDGFTLPMFELSDAQALSDVTNSVLVLGYVYPRRKPVPPTSPGGGLYPGEPAEPVWQYNRPYSFSTWDTALVSDPPLYVIYQVESDLIETDGHADTLRTQLEKRHNLLPKMPTLVVPGNPGIRIGHIVGLTSVTAELPAPTPLVCVGYQHTWTGEEATTRITPVRSDGAAGTIRDPRPIPDFSVGGTQFSSQGFITQFNSAGPWINRWENDVNGQTNEGLDKTEYVISLTGMDGIGFGAGNVRLEAEDPRTRIRNYRWRSINPGGF